MTYDSNVISPEVQSRRKHYQQVLDQWSANLYELDEHATYQLLAAGDMSGVTGDRTNDLIASAPLLWSWMRALRNRMDEVDERIAKGTRFSNNSAEICLLYTSPSPRDATLSRMPSSA